MTSDPKIFEKQIVFEAGCKEYVCETSWFVSGIDFDTTSKWLTIQIDFTAGTRFPHPEVAGAHPVHDTVVKRYRHLNFFEHDCYLEVRTPRVKLPDGRVALVEPSRVGKLSGFTLLFEAIVLTLAQQMPFAAVARAVGESWHRVHAICKRYVELALAEIDLSAAVDETSNKRGHNFLTLMADAKQRKVVFVTEGRDAASIGQFAAHLQAHNVTPGQVTSVSIDMSPTFIKGVSEHLPNARVTFEKFHVVTQASFALDKTRRLEQKTAPDLKGLRLALLRDREWLSVAQRADLDALVASVMTKRTARAWLHREQSREILDRKQIKSCPRCSSSGVPT